MICTRGGLRAGHSFVESRGSRRISVIHLHGALCIPLLPFVSAATMDRSMYMYVSAVNGAFVSKYLVRLLASTTYNRKAFSALLMLLPILRFGAISSLADLVSRPCIASLLLSPHAHKKLIISHFDTRTPYTSSLRV